MGWTAFQQMMMTIKQDESGRWVRIRLRKALNILPVSGIALVGSWDPVSSSKESGESSSYDIGPGPGPDWRVWKWVKQGGGGILWIGSNLGSYQADDHADDGVPRWDTLLILNEAKLYANGFRAMKNDDDGHGEQMYNGNWLKKGAVTWKEVSYEDIR